MSIRVNLRISYCPKSLAKKLIVSPLYIELIILFINSTYKRANQKAAEIENTRNVI